MTKMFEATCVSGVVHAEGVSVPSAEILSEGVGASDGVLLIDENLARYIAKISPDLKLAIEKTIAALSAVEALATAAANLGTGTIGSGGISPASGAGGLITTAIGAVNTAKGNVSSVKAELQTLKDGLK